MSKAWLEEAMEACVQPPMSNTRKNSRREFSSEKEDVRLRRAEFLRRAEEYDILLW
jgi:hypothetical protein